MNDNDRKVLDMIIDDLQEDAYALDGQPFDGKTVARVFGELMATTRALACIVRNMSITPPPPDAAKGSE